MIDIIDIKKAVEKGELKFYVRECYKPMSCEKVKCIYAENDVGEKIIVGYVNEEVEK